MAHCSIVLEALNLKYIYLYVLETFESESTIVNERTVEEATLKSISRKQLYILISWPLFYDNTTKIQIALDI